MGVNDLDICVEFQVLFFLYCRCIHFLLHFSYTASEDYDILESENFFDTEVYLQPPNYGLNSGEDSDSEEGTDSQHLSAGQLIAQADFRIDFGTRITNSLEAECDDIEKMKTTWKKRKILAMF